MFILGIVTWLVGKIFGSKQTFEAAIAVVAWAYVPPGTRLRVGRRAYPRTAGFRRTVSGHRMAHAHDSSTIAGVDDENNSTTDLADFADAAD